MHRHFHDELNDVKMRLLTMSGEAEAALGAGGRGAAGARQQQGPERDPERPDHRHHGDGDRGDVHQSPRPAAADGARPADAHLGAQDRQRPRAGGRSRGQHRPVRRPAGAGPADHAGAGDRRDGPARAGHAVRRPRGVHPGRRRGGPGDLPPGRQGRRPAPVGVPHPADPHDGGPAHDRRRHGAPPGEPEPGAGGRPRHQRRRGRRLPGGRASPSSTTPRTGASPGPPASTRSPTPA